MPTVVISRFASVIHTELAAQRGNHTAKLRPTEPTD
jgi:hypothetical protein